MPYLIPSMAGVHLSGVMLGILPLGLNVGAVMGKEGQLKLNCMQGQTAVRNVNRSYVMIPDLEQR